MAARTNKLSWPSLTDEVCFSRADVSSDPTPNISIVCAGIFERATKCWVKHCCVSAAAERVAAS